MGVPVHYLVVKQARLTGPTHATLDVAHQRALTACEDSAEDIGVYKLVGYYGAEVEAIEQEIEQ